MSSKLTRRISTRIASAGMDLRRLDAYPKTIEDFRVKTYAGAIVSVVSVLFALLLFLAELKHFLTTRVSDELFVDTSSGEKLRINLDITMHSLHCDCMCALFFPHCFTHCAQSCACWRCKTLATRLCPLCVHALP